MRNILILLTVILSLNMYANTNKKYFGLGESFKIQLLQENFETIWGMDFLDKDRMIFTTIDGKAYILSLRNNKLKEIKKLPKVLVQGQGGLLDVAYKDGYIYLTFVKELEKDGVTTLARGKLQDDTLVEYEELIQTKSKTNTSRHFGSRIAFDDKGHIFFGVGDRGVRDNGQNLQVHAGKILRLNLNGTIPNDNPFLNVSNVLPEIYAYGIRNPQGLFYDKRNKKLYENEHGPRGGDEINIIKAGANYGWAKVSHGKEYWGPFDVGEAKTKEGMEDPIKVYIPSIAPSSLLIYSGKVFKRWKGVFFNSSLALTHINMIKFDKNMKQTQEVKILRSLEERIRDIVEDEKGFIYFSTDSGKIYKIYK